MDFEDVSVLKLVICSDHATCSPVDAADEARFQIGVHTACHRLGGDAGRNHERIREDAPVTVDPSAFVLDGVDHDAIKRVEHHRVKQGFDARASRCGKRTAHAFQGRTLGLGQRSIF